MPPFQKPFRGSIKVSLIAGFTLGSLCFIKEFLSDKIKGEYVVAFALAPIRIRP
jgi:hypothetical protein